MFMLRNRAPERFSEGGALGLSAVDKMRLKRMKAAWRQEWDEEHRRKEPDMEEVRRELLQKVDAMKNAERQRWTQREWRLYGAWQMERLNRRKREREEYDARYPGAYRREGEIVDELPSLPDIIGDEELG
jgi:hypothetical protein